jgi:elongator complex protein 1
MPRGNLEGVYPRIILCKQIVQMIKDKAYGKAFRLLRQNKIDINMMYDVNPEQFLEHID